jgi:uncharacterized membrane protein YkvI
MPALYVIARAKLQKTYIEYRVPRMYQGGYEVKDTSLGAFRIASAYIGTVVGAGFSSGQEILRFFTAYGWAGMCGIVVVTALFFFFGYTALLLGRNLKAKSHLEIVRFTNGRFFGSAIDMIITLFLFGGLGAMFAGAGAVFQEQFGLAPVWGILCMAIIATITVMTGIKGVVNAISSVVPLLIFAVVYISICSLAVNPLTPKDIELSKTVAGATPNWFISAVNYASYNLVIAIAVLAPIGAGVQNKKRLFRGALFGALGLGLSIAAINVSMLTNISGVASFEIPTIAVAANISPGFRLLFAAVIFTEVYSTALGDLLGLSRRVSLHVPKNLLIALAAAGAFIASQLGFSNLVRFMYPAVGYGALLFFAGAVYVWIKKRDSLR